MTGKELYKSARFYDFFMKFFGFERGIGKFINRISLSFKTPPKKILEVGCGTGPICRLLSTMEEVDVVVGVDPSERLVEKAKELSRGSDKVSYEVGDGKSLRFADAEFDTVILHTILTHVPAPAGILAEAKRVLKGGGWLGVCDGDFATATLGVGNHDPLEACTASFVDNFVTDKYFVCKVSGRLPQYPGGSRQAATARSPLAHLPVARRIFRVSIGVMRCTTVRPGRSVLGRAVDLKARSYSATRGMPQ